MSAPLTENAPAPDAVDLELAGVWIALAVLAAARAGLAFNASMALWSLPLPRWLPFRWGWLPTLAASLALVPLIGRRAAPSLARLGDAFARRPLRLACLAAVVSMAVVWALPDRTLFLGDFAMRSGTILADKDPAHLFPQAMPLDILTHVRLPQALKHAVALPVQDLLRLLALPCAALLGMAAALMPAALAIEGAAAIAAALIVWGGGYLGMFTGYGKSAIELTAFTAIAGVAALRVARDGRGLLMLAVATALALAYHRSGVLLLPAAIAGIVLAPGSWRTTRALAAVVLAAALVAFGPRAWHVITTFDSLHHLAPPDARSTLGRWLGVVAPVHLLDVLNVTAVLSPLALALPAFAPQLRRAPRREALMMAALILPALAMLLLTRPQQGLLRDRDVFAQAGAALSVLMAWLVAGLLRSAPGRAWLALGIALSAVVPSVQWLGLMHRQNDGLRMVRAYIEGKPERSAEDRAATWDFLGTSAMVDHHVEEAAACFARAVQAADSPRLIGQWGMTETMLGNYSRADSLFRRAVTLNPDFTLGWVGLGAAASWIGDTASCAEAEHRIGALDPANAVLPQLRGYLERARAGRP